MSQEDYYQKPGLSNSALSKFNYDVTLFHKIYITKEFSEKTSESMKLGSLVHLLILEPEKFIENYVVIEASKVTGMMGIYIRQLAETGNEELAYTKAEFKQSHDTVKKNFLKKDNQTFYNQLLEAKDKIVLSNDEFQQAETLCNLAEAIDFDKILNPLVEWTEYKELEIYFDITDERSNILHSCKSKLDRLFVSKDGSQVVYMDYKTDGQNAVWNYKESFEYWKTFRQLAYYQKAIEAFMETLYSNEDKVFNLEHYIVAIDTKRNLVLPYRVGQSYIEKGMQEIDKDLKDLRWHMDYNLWQYPRSVYEAMDVGELILTCDE